MVKQSILLLKIVCLSFFDKNMIFKCFHFSFQPNIVKNSSSTLKIQSIFKSYNDAQVTINGAFPYVGGPQNGITKCPLL